MFEARKREVHSGFFQRPADEQCVSAVIFNQQNFALQCHRLSCRKADFEGAAFSQFGLQGNRPAHTIDAALHNCESYSRSGIFVRTMQALKDLENPIPMLWRDSNSLIFHLNANGLAKPKSLDGNRRKLSRFSEL